MTYSHGLADPARRSFFKGILAIGAAGGLAHNLPTAATIASQFLGDVSAALGAQRLLASCQDIREKFVGAKSGELMCQYQTFWPLVLNDPEFLPQLEAACTEPSELNDHRRRALPAVAALHSSASQDARIRDFAARILFDTHKGALDHDENREVLEIIWQNVVAALIRNQLNWQTIWLEERLLSQGLSVCQRFLTGEQGLFMAAMAAFHAMLTYRLALQSRPHDNRTEGLDRTIGSILDLEMNGPVRWFERLRTLIDSRPDFELALPQTTEVLMGHSSFDSDAADFAIAVRVHHFGVLQKIVSGKIQTPFISRERAAASKTLPLLIDYGITPEIWSRVRGGAGELLGAEDLRSADVLFRDYDAHKRSSLVLKQTEGGTARLLAARVPFRNQPEKPIVGTSMNEDAIQAVAKSEGFAGGLPGLLLTAEFLSGRKDFDRATVLRVDEACGIILEEFRDLILKPLSFFDEWLRELPTSTTSISTHVGVASSRSPSGAAAHSPSKMEAQLDIDLNLLRKKISDTWKGIGIEVEPANVTLVDHLENASKVVPQWNEELHAALNDLDRKAEEHD